MLVLTRRIGEEIVLPRLGVTISLQQVRATSVSLGFRAPPDVTIMRREVLERRQAPKITATDQQPKKAVAQSSSGSVLDAAK